MMSDPLRLVSPAVSGPRGWKRIWILVLSASIAALSQSACVFDENSNGGNTSSGAANERTNIASTPSPTPAPQAADTDPKIERYIDAAVADLDPRVKEAIPRIEGTGRKLLALRGYLRRDELIDQRWAWTDEEVKKFEGSPEYQEMMDVVDKVKSTFADMNPGYTLSVNTNVRTLDQQLENWNTTQSVRSAGQAMLEDAQREISGPAYKDEPQERSLENFTRFLRSYIPRPEPTVAVPGLSPHGQLRAFDFVIQKDGETIAGFRTSDVKSAWDEPGWTKKLNEAVLRASNKFRGPLTTPNEPWHYTYVP